MRNWWMAAALLLAGCAGAGSWTKAGADEASAARDYQECRDLAQSAVKTDADIDQDILAARHNDWQRASVYRLRTEARREHTSDRATAIVDSCTSAKGFAKPR